jgi:hypothetical protein
MGEGQATKNGPVKHRLLGYYCKEWDAAIVGAYPDLMHGGGCDQLFPEEVVRRVTLFNEQYQYVFLEGILVSHTFERYSALAREIANYNFYFLNTPLEECIKRVRARNAASTSNTKKPFSDVNIKKDYKNIWITVRTKCKRFGHKVIELDYKNPVAQLLKELELCGEEYPIMGRCVMWQMEQSC